MLPHTRIKFTSNRSADLLICRLKTIFLGIISALLFSTLQAAELDIKIDGIEDDSLLKKLQKIVEVEMADEDIPQNAARLRHIARQHTTPLEKLMRAEGYYSATIVVDSVKIVDPPQIHYRIVPGPQITFNKVNIKLIDPENGYIPDPQIIHSLSKGQPALAQQVLDAVPKLRDAAREAGYPHAQVIDTSAIVDHAKGVMDVEFKLQTGVFGKLALPSFEGLATVRDTTLLAKIPWEEGERYQPKLEAELKRQLLETQLFSVVLINYGEQLGSDGLMPVTVELKERKHRTLSAGVRYHSDDGPGTTLGWEHRNFFGGGELLDLDLDVADKAQVMDMRYRKPDFFRHDQSLLMSLTAERRRTDAFDSLAVDTSIGLGRRLAPKMGVNIGISYRLSDVEQQGEDESHGLLSLPVSFIWDNTDKVLDATRGFRMRFDGAPYTDTLNKNVNFTRLNGLYSHYLKVVSSPRTVLAGRLSLGSMIGVSLDSIPPDIRFYAGGGSSVRGIGFQLASPLDENNDPVGGRSLFELSLEARLRIAKSIGVVAFLDGGAAYRSQYPDFDENPRFGAGLGLRYHTPIGPLRFDVGVPLDKRAGIDDSYQIYISLGQAF